MTPAERDDVRTFAAVTLAAPESSTIERMEARAILRYVPAGDVDTHALARVERIDGRPARVLDRHAGCEYVITSEEARARGLALLAAADAAEES